MGADKRLSWNHLHIETVFIYACFIFTNILYAILWLLLLLWCMYRAGSFRSCYLELCSTFECLWRIWGEYFRFDRRLRGPCRPEFRGIIDSQIVMKLNYWKVIKAGVLYGPRLWHRVIAMLGRISFVVVLCVAAAGVVGLPFCRLPIRLFATGDPLLATARAFSGWVRNSGVWERGKWPL